MREEYKNGDEIQLKENGCDGCSPSVVNGVFCHEQGCPDAWRDSTKACDECGCDFYRTERYDSICDGCRNGNYDYDEEVWDWDEEEITDECDAEFNAEFEDAGFPE
jgi:hypothetical protein